MNTRDMIIFGGTLTAVFALSGVAHAAEPEAGAEAEAGGSVEGGKVTLVADGGVTKSGAPINEKWITRHRPRAHDLNLGIYGGVFFTDSEIELRDATVPIDDWDEVAPDIGLRLGYYPIPHFGLEGEFSAIPTRNGGDSAFMYAARAQGVLQPGFWSVTPFLLVGGGVLGVASPDSVVGNEADPALHVGGGIKFFINDKVHLRLDGRAVLSPKLGRTEVPAVSPEALLTVAFRFGVAPKPEPPPPPPPDKDGDGIADEEDHCPFDPGVEAYKGCPVPDSDCDTVKDDVDKCPEEAGEPTDGCPLPDRDKDGILDDQDQCPDEPGPAPSGCPTKDTDGDGIIDNKDKCPNEPETANGFDDLDGCPDTVPEEVKKFNGVIQGIFFDTNKATIKPTSEPVLDNAAEVLTKYEQLKVEIVGHTDTRGKRERNLTLSKDRAESVKAYLVSKGVDASRIQTRGAGPDEPIAENNTRAGRAKNRRIEFRLLQ